MTIFWFCLVFLLVIVGRGKAASQSDTLPSHINNQKAKLSDADASTLTSLGMSAAQIQSIFGTQTPGTPESSERSNQRQIDIDTQTAVSSRGRETPSSRDNEMQQTEDEYEYESYDSEDDMGVSIPNEKDSQRNNARTSDDDWKMNKEWWRDPLALFDEDSSQPKDPNAQVIMESQPETKTNSITTSGTSDASTDSEIRDVIEPEMLIPSSNLVNATTTDNFNIDTQKIHMNQEILSPALNSSSQKNIIPFHSGAISISGLSLLYLQKALSMSPTFFNVAVSYIIGKYFFQMVQKLKGLFHERYDGIHLNGNNVHRSDDKAQSPHTQDTEQESKDGDLDDLSISEMEQFQDLGFGRSVPTRRYRPSKESTDVSENAKEKASEYDHGDKALKEKDSFTKDKYWGWFNKRKRDDSEILSRQKGLTHESKEKKGLLFPGKRFMEQEIQRLHEEIELLRETNLEAESQRVKYQTENDLTRRELQGIRKQLEELHHTNKLLKAQLRDNSQTVTQAIQAERRKAEDDLLKVKAAMVRVLERERKTMRSHVKKILSTVRESMIPGDMGNDENTIDVNDNTQQDD